MSLSTLKLPPRLALVSALLLGAAPALAEDSIHTLVAVTTEGSCASALGYVVEVGERDKARSAAEEKAQARYPTLKRRHHKDNLNKSRESMGRHLVVLSAGITKEGCTGRAMGVGFGADEASAKKDAKKNLGKNFPFNDGALKVEHSQRY